MAVLCVPPIDDEPWPTLGPQVAAFIESYLVFGPGDLRGQPAKLDAEKRALIYRAYEIYPQGHQMAGRRRFKRVAFSLRKGSAKSELAAWIAACELHPDAPVRCDGWDTNGQPVGVGVNDPYIPLIAYTEEQSEELVYGALRVILAESVLAEDFDNGVERVMRRGGDGKALPLSTAPNARDGARTTFQVFDETHRLCLPNLKSAHRTMMANIPKRKLADAWSLEVTTAPAPGEGSIAEDTMEYARAVADGRVKDSRLFFFHRQASDELNLYHDDGALDEKAVRAAVLEASGPVAVWSDIDGIVDQWRDPTADRTYLERVWLNRLVRASQKAFDVQQWRSLARPDFIIPDGAGITLGFDGARYHDSTAIVGTHIESGYQWLIGLWEQPFGDDNWEVPASEVEEAIAEAFRRWDVWRLYADPPYWESYVDKWAGEYGQDRVMLWWTNRQKPMSYALRGYRNAMTDGTVTHDGNQAFGRHIGNACRRDLIMRDDEGKPLWTIYKERSDSPLKIDAAMAGALSWEARGDAVAAGVGVPSIYEERGLRAF